MSKKQGDLCPHCKIGRLSVHPDRMASEKNNQTASYRTWLCDNPECGKTCRDNYIGLTEHVGITENVVVKLNDETRE